MNLTFDEMIERTLRPNVHTIFYSLKKAVDEVLPLLGIKEFYVKPAHPGCGGVEFFVLSKEDKEKTESLLRKNYKYGDRIIIFSPLREKGVFCASVRRS